MHLPPPLVPPTILLLCVTALWAMSVRLANVSIVDVFWGSGFAIVATAGWLSSPHNGAWLLVVLTSVWGLRLTLHLAVRNLGHGEDRRYAAMRKSVGQTFWWRSLFTVFWLQAGLIMVVSSPVLMAIASDSGPTRHFALLLLGSVLWVAGLATEALADAQLSAFKKNPDNRNKVMDQGLWRYSRHPNYFGDSVVWWGLYILSLYFGAPAWTAIGPVVMTVLLRNVSGVTLLESTIGARRPGYAAYVERTSPFVPWPRKRP